MRKWILTCFWCLVVLCPLAAQSSTILTAVRSYDGSGNNPTNPSLGAAQTPLIRIGVAAYPGDHSGSTMVEPPDRPNPRDISNAIVAQSDVSVPNDRNLSDFVWIWGQFLDHDISLTEVDDSYGTADIPINHPADPLGPDPIPVDRSRYDNETGTGSGNPRQQVNEITSFIDASNVYGSDEARADALRTFSGGKMTTTPKSAGDLLPLNDSGLPNAGGSDNQKLFLAGDVRANEQLGLTAMHTLFVREHNRLAELIAARLNGLPIDPTARDEEIYQIARKLVGAEMQIITYNEFLPAFLDVHAPKATDFSYNATVDPSIANEFSTAFFRGHSFVPPNLPLMDNGKPIGSIELKSAFFSPEYLYDSPENLEYLLSGFSSHRAQEFDNEVIDDLRHFLFGPPGAGGLDLPAMNIQRGRDHGLPDYNRLREAYDWLGVVDYEMLAVTDFDEITSDPALQSALRMLYGSVDNIDPWIGGIVEKHLPGCSSGELVTAALVDQFIRLRDGDRFFFLNDPDLWQEEILEIVDLKHLSLADVIRANTGITRIQDDVFFASTPIPEPSTVLLFGGGLVGLAAVVRKRRPSTF